MTLTTFFNALIQLALAGAILLLGHYGYGWIAAVLAVLPVAIGWYRGGRSWSRALTLVPQLLFGLSVVTFISLSRQPLGQSVFPVGTQVAVAVLYGIGLIWLRRLPDRPLPQLTVLGINQLFAVADAFLAAAFWRWPDIIVIAVIWAASFLNALWYLEARGERSARLLAASWALVAGEISWVLFNWQVNYIINSGYVIVPQAAIITAGIGYCLTSIHGAHSDKRLSRRRLIEYVAIAGVLLAIVIAGTRWNGTT